MKHHASKIFRGNEIDLATRVLWLVVAGVALLGGAAVLVALGARQAARQAVAVFPDQFWILLWSSAALGTILTLAAVISWLARRRIWIEVLPEGFLVHEAKGEWMVQDGQIVSIGAQHRCNYVNRRHKSTTRVVTVWIAKEDADEPFTMSNTFFLSESDPLAGFIKRVGDRLLARARDDLQKGGTLEGQDWSLDKDTLTTRVPGQEASFSRNELVQTGNVDDHVCVWVRGKDEPAFKVPMNSENGHLLLQILDEQLRGRTDQKPETEGESLGRVIFERRTSSAASFIAASLTAFVGFALLSGNNLITLALGAPFVALALGLVLQGLNCRVGFFRCRKWGIHCRGLFGDKQLRYRDVAAFTYEAIDFYIHGSYSSTNITLTFDPVREQAANKIRFWTNIKVADAELDRLRDQIARILGSRMYQQLQNKVPVRWTANLCFLPDGLEYDPSGLLGRKETQVLPYDQISGYNLDKGTFYLWARGEQKPIVQQSAATPNFYPGYAMLTWVTKPSK